MHSDVPLLPVKPVRVIANRRQTCSKKPSLLNVVHSRRRSKFSPVKTFSRKSRKLLHDMSFGWKLFFLCTSFIIACGLLTVVLVTVEEKDDPQLSFHFRKHPRDIRNTNIHSMSDRNLQWDSRNAAFHSTSNRKPQIKSTMSTVELLKHPRVLDFCHHPENAVTGMEGFAPEGFELKQVHIVLNSGQKIFNNIDQDFPLSSPHIDCNFDGSQFSHSKIQSFLHVTKRYSEQNSNTGSFSQYNLFPSKQKCEHQQLSPLGAMQLINVGDFLQEIYIKRWKLEKSKSKPKRLYAKSVLQESSFQSLVAFLHGFLSQKHFLNMKISKAEDDFCEEDSRVPCKCRKSMEANRNTQKAIDDGKVLFRPENRVEDGLKSMLGLPVHSKVSAKEILYLLSSSVCNKQHLSCLNSKCLNITASALDLLFETVDKVTENFSQEKQFVDFVNLFMHPFINLLNYRLKRVQNLFEQVFIYSADESFILYLLTAIKFHVRRTIRPASRVIFELYKNTASEVKPYYIRVLFNGEDITNSIPLCHSHLRNGMCKLKYFVDYHSIESKHHFNNISYANMCNTVKKDLKK